MTSKRRKQLEDAMVTSQLENLKNVDAEDSMAEVIEDHMRNGHKGFAQMDDAELLETAKNDVGYSAGEVAEPWDNNDGINEMVKLINLITEIEKEQN